MDPVTLEHAVRWLRVLRVVTDDGRHLYPAWQMKRGTVVDGLQPVLETPRAGADDPWSWALWLCSVVRDDDGGDGVRGQIDDLIAGRLAGVLHRANQVADEWAP